MEKDLGGTRRARLQRRALRPCNSLVLDLVRAGGGQRRDRVEAEVRQIGLDRKSQERSQKSEIGDRTRFRSMSLVDIRTWLATVQAE